MLVLALCFVLHQVNARLAADVAFEAEAFRFKTVVFRVTRKCDFGVGAEDLRAKHLLPSRSRRNLGLAPRSDLDASSAGKRLADFSQCGQAAEETCTAGREAGEMGQLLKFTLGPGRCS